MNLVLCLCYIVLIHLTANILPIDGQSSSRQEPNLLIYTGNLLQNFSNLVQNSSDMVKNEINSALTSIHNSFKQLLDPPENAAIFRVFKTSDCRPSVSSTLASALVNVFVNGSRCVTDKIDETGHAIVETSNTTGLAVESMGIFVEDGRFCLRKHPRFENFGRALLCTVKAKLEKGFVEITEAPTLVRNINILATLLLVDIPNLPQVFGLCVSNKALLVVAQEGKKLFNKLAECLSRKLPSFA
ncbi:uncharacterized protein LOC106648632 [Trichogramma pretiosum]|uniref:uncharacterized protein LOC106648632 n=1 Tax=Trichogramma pretiosum TaxID=7493 RepID=UPI0006C952CF|nr:uncharacterized protein LOC106648632 [Trichogramma pretiosum]XP_023315343.1 uncharacterized protein LOC106648632 [Trichogramma pretiosum]XP_023315344.1 uncharacterized protein LOC106648632 [Trichogramma pretiosum]